MSGTTIDHVARATPPKVARRIKGLSDRAIAWIFVAPTIFLLLAINIFPLLWTIYLSFTNYRANRPNAEVKWIGTRNYERILGDADIWLTMQATAHFLFWTLVLQVLIARIDVRANAVDALEKTITDFYPYDAQLAPADKADKALLLLRREEDGDYVVKIEGPTKAHEVTLKGKSEAEVELGSPGLAVVETPSGRVAVFAEPGVAVIVAN